MKFPMAHVAFAASACKEAIDVELELQREPGLDLDVDEPEVGVHEVVVEERRHLRLADCA